VVPARVHGRVLARRAGVPALAVDPIAGGGKVSAQAAALGWPAVVGADDALRPGVLDRWWCWCLSAEGRAAAGRGAARSGDRLVTQLVDALVGEGQPA